MYVKTGMNKATLKEIRKNVYEALEHQRFAHASFKMGDSFMSNPEDTEVIKEATRLYRKTWIEYPLYEAAVSLEMVINGWRRELAEKRVQSLIDNPNWHL